LRRKAGQDAGKIKEDLKMKEMAREAVQAKKGKPVEEKTTQNSVRVLICVMMVGQTKSWRLRPELL